MGAGASTPYPLGTRILVNGKLEAVVMYYGAVEGLDGAAWAVVARPLWRRLRRHV